MERVDRHDLARSAVVLAVGAVAALLVLLIAKRVWRDLECGDAHTLALDAIVTTMAFLAGASVVVGVLAIVARTQVHRSVAMMVLGGAVVALAFLPSASFRVELASYVCETSVA